MTKKEHQAKRDAMAEKYTGASHPENEGHREFLRELDEYVQLLSEERSKSQENEVNEAEKVLVEALEMVRNSLETGPGIPLSIEFRARHAYAAAFNAIYTYHRLKGDGK